MRTIAILLPLAMGWFGLGLGAVVAAPQAPEQVVVDARKELAEVEKLAESLQPGDMRTATQLQRRLDIVARKIKSARNQTHPDWADARSRFNAVSKRIADTANATAPATGADPNDLASLETDLSRAERDLKSNRLDQYDDPKFVADWNQRIADLRKRVEALPTSERKRDRHLNTVKWLEENIVYGQTQRQASQKGAANNQRLAAILATYEAAQMPRDLVEPLEAESVVHWVSSIRERLGSIMERDLAEVEALGLDPTTDRQKISSARHWIGSTARRQLEEKLAMAQGLIDGQADTGTQYADFILKVDIKNRDQVTNVLLGEGRFDECMARLNAGVKSVQVGQAFDRALDRKGGPDRSAQAAKMSAAVAHAQASAVSALDAVRMPAAKSKDPALLKIAEETFKNPDYGVGAWKRMLVSYDIQSRERYDTSVDRSGTRASLTTYHYKWQEFGVLTAEKVGNDWYLFYNLLKKFESGGSTTPIGRWILADRFQSTRILEENIDK